MGKLVLGCIADDFTGATDLANNLVRAGMRVVQAIGVPTTPLDAEVDAVVVALKSRTIAPAEAIAQSLDALRWLQAQGAQQIYFKYCSTFDSTPQGNIGPVTEALMDALQCDFTIATPAFPDNKRTVFKGYLFAGDVLLNESGMQNHPLTPMTDANLVRVLQAQCTRKVGLIDHTVVARGDTAVTERIAQLKSEGVSVAIVDAVSNDDLLRLGPALAKMPLVTAGLGRGHRIARQLRALAFFAGQRVAGSERAARRGVGQLFARHQPAGARLHPARRCGAGDRSAAHRGGRRCRGRGAGMGRTAGRQATGAGLFHRRGRRREVGAGQARRGGSRRDGRAHHRRHRTRPGRQGRAPTGRRGRRNLGRLRAGTGHRADADRPADRPRRAVVPCARRGCRGRGRAHRAQVRQLRRRRFLHQGLRVLA
jgi:hypothetical protein